jgi:ABC-2 type transport system ATP-binding protein
MRLGDAIELFRARYPDFRASVAEAILDVLALSRKVRVGECSKGMSEQLHIALTIARAPDLYLFDEPLASIDPATRIRVIDIIREHRSGSATLLISTHLIDSVSSLFDDIVIIDRGRILLDQSVQAATCYGSLGLEEVYLTAVGAL